MTDRDILIFNIKKLHTTKMGIDRISKNLCLNVDNIVLWCKNKIIDENSNIIRKGKNYYIKIDNYIITVNAYSYTIITAHKINVNTYTICD